MSGFNQEDFNSFILDQDVVGFHEEPVVLKSGRQANWYVNWRNVSEDVFLFDRLTDYVVSFVEDIELVPDCFCGVPEGATKLGIITQYKWAKIQPNYGLGGYPLPMLRGKTKAHGAAKDRYFLGSPKGRTIIIEDVTTTGESLIATLDYLLKMDSPVIACISVTDRNEVRSNGKTAGEAVEERGVSYYSMSNAIDLLSEAYDKLKPGAEIADKVERYFAEYGARKIKLTRKGHGSENNQR